MSNLRIAGIDHDAAAWLAFQLETKLTLHRWAHVPNGEIPVWMKAKLDEIRMLATKLTEQVDLIASIALVEGVEGIQGKTVEMTLDVGDEEDDGDAWKRD